MSMISLMILFHSGMIRFMDDPVKKLRLLLKFAMRALGQFLSQVRNRTFGNLVGH